MQKINIKISSIIHRRIFNNLKETFNVRTDTKCFIELIERFKIQEIELKRLTAENKKQKIKIHYYSRNDVN
jgi:hypothetical protein